jgi:WD40 repeat protein
VIVWDRTTGAPGKWILANRNGDHISDVTFSPDGRDLLTACLGDGGVQRWRTGSWRRKPAFGTRSNCDGELAVSPDGRTVATADNGKGEEMRLKLWNYPKGTHRKTSKQAIGGAVRIEFSPDGTLIATNDNWRRVRLWDGKTLAPVAEYTPQLKIKKRTKLVEPVSSFAFHPSGRYLAVTGQAGPVEFLDTNTWKPTVAFDWKHGGTYGVTFSSDGTLAAAGSKRGIVVWDVDV